MFILIFQLSSSLKSSRIFTQGPLKHELTTHQETCDLNRGLSLDRIYNTSLSLAVRSGIVGQDWLDNLDTKNVHSALRVDGGDHVMYSSFVIGFSKHHVA